MRRQSWWGIVLTLLIALGARHVYAQQSTPLTLDSTGFTYQGHITNGDAAVHTTCDFEFRLYDAAEGGTLVGGPLSKNGVPVNNGLFTVELDFGAGVFDGAARWLGVAVACPAGSGTPASLSPRHALTATPYALYAGGAAWTGLRGVPATLSNLAALACTADQGPRWDGAAWVCASGIGPQGPQGPQGVKGDQGPAGVKGDPGDPGPRPARVIWVAKSGGDFTTLTAALNSIGDAAADRRYLIKIGPGVYTEQVTLKSYVDLEGSGEGVTVLHWTGGNTLITGDAEGINSASNATLIADGILAVEVRSLSVVSQITDAFFALAVYTRNLAAGSVRLRNVTATASGGFESFAVVNHASAVTLEHVDATVASTSNFAVAILNRTGAAPTIHNARLQASGAGSTYGLYNSQSTSHVENIHITTTGGGNAYGIYTVEQGSAVTMRNAVISVSGGSSVNYGVANSTAAAAAIYNSSIRATTRSVINFSGSTAKVAHTQLDGALQGTGITCIGAYDANLAAVTC